MKRRTFLKTAGAGAAALAAPRLARALGKPMDRPNVLFIPVDDLRPQLGCYGRPETLSPNLDRLAAGGIVFERAYCQVPVCGASRASLLTGVRPARRRFVDFKTRAEDDLPGARTLPQHFREAGYAAVGLGKVFHHLNDTADRSWSEEPWHPKGGWGGRGYLLDENRALAEGNTRKRGCGPAWEAADVEDRAYADGMLADRAVEAMRRLAKGDKPWFLAAGFFKPHLPFNAPKRYWDRYEHARIELAPNPYRPKNAPDAAMHSFGELRAYTNIPRNGPIDEETARHLIHGYYACTSFHDAQVGRLLAELEELGLDDRTIVVLWGDHGWQLGEHGLWCKHANFQTSLGAPLVVRAPGVAGGKRTRRLVEFLDIYPTLCELAGLEPPGHLEGTSFAPLLQAPDRAWKEAAFSRYYNGDSVKTDRYLYTEWRKEDGGEVYARMLYDHETDPAENVNLAERPEMADVVAAHAKRLAEGPPAPGI